MYEGQACAAAFLFIYHLCQFMGIKKPKSIYYCDNKGLIMKLKNNCCITKHSTSQDILHVIKKIITPSDISFRHVKAHQDERTTNLSYPEYLNCLVDKIAFNNTTQTKQCTPDNTFAIFHLHQYIPQQFDQYMRIHHFQDDAKNISHRNTNGTITHIKTSNGNHIKRASSNSHYTKKDKAQNSFTIIFRLGS